MLCLCSFNLFITHMPAKLASAAWELQLHKVRWSGVLISHHFPVKQRTCVSLISDWEKWRFLCVHLQQRDSLGLMQSPGKSGNHSWLYLCLFFNSAGPKLLQKLHQFVSLSHSPLQISQAHFGYMGLLLEVRRRC